MNKGPATAVYDRDARTARIAGSAVLIGSALLGERVLLAEGAVLRSRGTELAISTGSAVLENSVVVGTPQLPTRTGRRSTFGHRCLVIGATVGDLCEMGNASTLMPGSTLGDRVSLGEGTLVPAGMHLPSAAAIGKPSTIPSPGRTGHQRERRDQRTASQATTDHCHARSVKRRYAPSVKPGDLDGMSACAQGTTCPGSAVASVPGRRSLGGRARVPYRRDRDERVGLRVHRLTVPTSAGRERPPGC